jgi:ribosomal protein S18 acetylase RimI-like enzyme
MPEIKQAALADLDCLARCHRKAFPKALSSAMGTRYVKKMLEWYIVDPRAFMFFVAEGEKYVGYCGGLKFDGTTRFGSASSMIQHSFNLAVKTFLLRPWLFFHREFIPKYGLAWRNIRKRLGGNRRTPAARDAALPEPHAGLIVIGVDPDYQGKGYGSLLLKEFERQAREAGFSKLHLTVRSDNQRAINTYQRNGWSVTESNQKSTSMVKQLPRI